MSDRHDPLAAFTRQETHAAISQSVHGRRREKTQSKMTCDEAQELITGLIDGELRDPELGSLTMHLEGCSRCRLSLEVERSLKQAVHNSAMRLRAPSKLRDRILSDQSASSEKRRLVGWRHYLPPMGHFARPALAAAVLLVIMLP